MPKRRRPASGDSDALAFAEREGPEQPTGYHVKKRKLKNSGLVVSFDPVAHRHLLEY